MFRVPSNQHYQHRTNQKLRSWTNAVFQTRGVCGQAFPSFPSPLPRHFFFFFALFPTFLDELARKRFIQRLTYLLLFLLMVIFILTNLIIMILITITITITDDYDYDSDYDYYYNYIMITVVGDVSITWTCSFPFASAHFLAHHSRYRNCKKQQNFSCEILFPHSNKK